MKRSGWIGASVLLGVGAWAATFDTPPGEPISALPAALQAGSDFHLQDPADSDGLMPHYVIESRFGEFHALGREALKVRVREMAALSHLAKMNDVVVVANTVRQRVKTDASTVGKVATHPVSTVGGIPRGISHLFQGYKAQADEALDSAKKSAHRGQGEGIGKKGSHLVEGAKHQATRYADRYLGISAAERHYYQELGVDPYTDNQVLRKAVKRAAKVQAAVNVGMHFVGVPGIPYLSDVRRAMDAIYNEDPAVLRARNRKTLQGYGLTPEEVARYENTLLLSPTRQTVLAENAKLMEGVTGRDELFRHAMSLTSDDEVAVFIESTRLLAKLHASRPLKAILAGPRIPAAETTDGHVVVAGAFDAVYWTEEVASHGAALRASLPSAASGLELWLTGNISPTAREALQAKGWIVHEHAWGALGQDAGG